MVVRTRIGSVVYASSIIQFIFHPISVDLPFIYPLVMTNIAMDNYYFWEKLLYMTWPFSSSQIVKSHYIRGKKTFFLGSTHVNPHSPARHGRVPSNRGLGQLLHATLHHGVRQDGGRPWGHGNHGAARVSVVVLSFWRQLQWKAMVYGGLWYANNCKSWWDFTVITYMTYVITEVLLN